MKRNTRGRDEVRRRRRAVAATAKPALCIVCAMQPVAPGRTTCSDECLSISISRRSVPKPERTIVNNFLPHDAEENRLRIPVPSPETIKERCRELRESVGMIWDASDLS